MAHPHAHSHADRQAKAHAMIARTGHSAVRARGGHAGHEDFAADAKMISSAVHQHEDHEHGGKHTKLRFKSGGAVEGHAAHHHLGKRARGGPAGKKSTHVNVIVAPQGGMHPAMPGMPAAGMAPRPPVAAPAPAMAPPRPPMAPPGAGMGPPGAGMMPPGGGMRPPGMMKRGGGVQKVSDAGRPSEELLQARRGGRTKKRDVGGPAGIPAQGAPAMGGQQPTAGQQQQPTPQQIMAARAMMAQRAQAAGQGAGQMPMQHRGGRTKRARGGHVPHMEAGAGSAEGRIEKMHEYGEGGFKPKEHPGEFGLKRRKG